MFAMEGKESNSHVENEINKELRLSRSNSFFLDLVSRTSITSEDENRYTDTELMEGVLENPVTKELLALTLQSVYEFKFLSDLALELHGSHQGLQEQLQKMQLILDKFSLHFKILTEVVVDGNTRSLEEIVNFETFASVREFYDITVLKPKVSPVVFEDTLKYIVKNLFIQLHMTLIQLNNVKPSITLEDAELDLQIIRSKMEAVIIYIPAVIHFKHDDLLAYPRTHSRWSALKNYYGYRDTAPESVIKKEYELTYRVINVAMSTLRKGKEEDGVLKDIIHLSGPVYFWLFREKAERMAKKNIAHATPEDMLLFWGLPDTELVHRAMKIVLPSVGTYEKFSIPRLFPQLTKEQLYFEAMGEKGIEVDPDLSAYMLKNAKRDITAELKELTKKSKSKIEIHFIYHRNFRFGEKHGDSEKHETTPTSSEEHKSQTPGIKKSIEKSIMEHFSGIKEDFQKLVDDGIGLIKGKPDPEMEKELSEVILHIHGGGFVSMSPESHQNYTRRWALATKRPIFSIDYRLAPENPFPAALDDCWQFYNWLLVFAKDLLGVNPKKIVFAGDSAGGNLILALALKAIKSGIKVPDGLVPVYPALYLNPNQYTPSLMNAMEDSMLSYSFLKLCLGAYIPSGYDANNFYLSPLNAPDDVLAKLPRTRLMIGEKDPLGDDCWRFLEKLVRLKKDVKMYVYRHLPHAFLSYDHIAGFEMIIGDSIAMIKELFALAECDL